MKYHITLLIALFISSTPAVFGQLDCDYEPEGKVLKLIEKAKDKKKYDSDQRRGFYEDALEENENCLLCLSKLGESSFKRAKRGGRGFGEAESYFSRIAESCPEYHSRIWYYLGAINYAEQNYEEALTAFDKFIHFPDDDESKFDKDYDKKYEEVQGAIPYVSFYKDFNKNEGKFEITRVEGVSSKDQDYLPTLSPDGELMFFTRKYMKKAKGDYVAKQVEEFTWSKRSDINATFDNGEALPRPFNMGDNYGGASISVDNKELFIAKKNPVPSNKENIDLYVGRYEFVFDETQGKKIYKWSELEPLSDLVNTEMGWESQPSLSGDGQTLYFATVRPECVPNPNGDPSTDIFLCTRQSDGSWSAPKSIGLEINTSANESAPYMHSDSHTLYFASDRKPSGGGYDIWYTRQQDDGSWSDPKNIGAPINTEEDERGMIVSADGEEAFFYANRGRSSQGFDVFSFPVPEEAKPEKVIILKGRVENENGGIPSDAHVELKYVDSKKAERIDVNGDDGVYATVVNVSKGEDVVMSVKGEGVAFNTHLIVDKEEEIPPAVVKLETKAEKVQASKSFEIPDIFYATSSADINRSSKLILDEFAAYLIENPKLYIEIGGHTDDKGSDGDNLALSMDRAFEIKGYLESMGVPGKRISAKGYGESKPVASNETAEGRAQNRRTEFTIKKM
ncbi:MAG: OmpA family protein [Flavobacteriales bacterium]|nr:OmpA family protein [Flavobacteriales bacterium]MDG2247238.1 OmpA family protein [Flavobacteriales bacterium]